MQKVIIKTKCSNCGKEVRIIKAAFGDEKLLIDLEEIEQQEFQCHCGTKIMCDIEKKIINEEEEDDFIF